MKILHVIPYFVPAWDYGGPVQVAYRLCKELVKRGHEVTVYTTDALDARGRIREKEEIVDGIRIRRFPNLNNSLAYKSRIFLSRGMSAAVKKELKSFAVAHLHEYWTLQNVIMHQFAVKYSIPYVIQAHGSLPIMADRQMLKRCYQNLWGKHLLADASRAIALTETEAGQYESRGIRRDRITIIPNGIDMAEFADLPPEGEFKKKHGIKDNEKIILYLGRIHKTKGIGLLMQAFARLAAENPDTRLAIVGPDSGYQSELATLARELGVGDLVLFTGALYGTEKLEAYVDSDVFVTPSFSGLPITFLESLACGLPIVTTDNGDNLDWIDRQTGFVTPFEVNQLRQAIAKILNNEALKQEFRENGLKLVREKFNWTVIAQQVEQVYSGL